MPSKKRKLPEIIEKDEEKEDEKQVTWIYNRETGLTSAEYPKMVKAISTVMQSHTWELTWKQVSSHIKGEMKQRFLDLVGGNLEKSILWEDGYDVTYNQRWDTQHKFEREMQSCYENMRKNERLSQTKKIFIDKERFLELERKVELLWLAPGMPGCLEEIEQAIKDF